MAKPELRSEARRLRIEEGLSLREICQRLGVSKSSASLWVRDLELTPEQISVLEKRHSSYQGQHNGSRANILKFREIRRQYQEEGRAKAREKDPLHVAGCMLYWGEGAKSRNRLSLANSDPDLLKHYVQFLRHALMVKDIQINIRIYCYSGNGVPVEQIENYWLETLELPRNCLKNSVVNSQPRSSQQKGRKLVNGVCAVDVEQSTHLIQHVYGAIQEYTGIEKPEWLF
jgi:hypothetical protein